MSKEDKNPIVPVTMIGGTVTGILWTIIAGTLWQWTPILIAMVAVYGMTSIIENKK